MKSISEQRKGEPWLNGIWKIVKFQKQSFLRLAVPKNRTIKNTFGAFSMNIHVKPHTRYSPSKINLSLVSISDVPIWGTPFRFGHP